MNNYDAIVIGGGPAGSTAAATLAIKGRKVVLLEKEKFPRYHIGESLLPYGYFTMERIGVLDKMKKSAFTKKYSVQFVSPDGRASVPFYFHTHLAHEAAQTWQVLRSEFDQLMLDNAREKGAVVHEETTVREGIWENGGVVGVKAVSKDGTAQEFRAPITIDATGRDTFFVTRSGWKIRDPYLNKIAVWTYYKGAKRDSGYDIPLAGDIVSVGVVAEKDYLYKDSKDLKEIFDQQVERNTWIKDHLAVGEQTGPYRVTGEYSYRSRHCGAKGLILTGDAFAFLDPVFSSGVFLALYSGEMGANFADACLTDNNFAAERFVKYGQEVCKSVESMRALVYAFYDHNFSFREYLKEFPAMKGDVTDCLIGNLTYDFKPMYEGMAKHAKLPEPLKHGAPLLHEEAVSI
jgi:flavin-dependent dehydrogenase